MTNYTHAILFVKSDSFEIVHCVCLKEAPNIATLKDIFNKLMFDDEFGFFDSPFVDSLIVHINEYKSFAQEHPEWVIEEYNE